MTRRCCSTKFLQMNVGDDPGAKKVIMQRGTSRQIKRKMEHSKQSICVTFCGNAKGELSSIVVYKAKHLHALPTEGSSSEASYDAPPSGWFDVKTSEGWFSSVFLPNVARKLGLKVITVNNISSHFSLGTAEDAVYHYNMFVTMLL